MKGGKLTNIIKIQKALDFILAGGYTQIMKTFPKE
jgi:hypothetical protein